MDATGRQLTANGTLLMAIMAPACLGMALTANGLAAALAGPRFAPGVALITPWMAAGTFFCSLRFHYLDYAFQLGRKPYLLAVVAGVAAALLLLLNLILIPLAGIVGAAAGVALAMGISCVHAAIAGRRAFAMPLPWRPAAKILLSCLVMSAAVLSIPAAAHARLLLQIVAGAGAYAAAVAALDILELRHHLVGFFYKTQRLAH
jgi:O-antigen/teichoic acid export membrane protein